MPTIQLVLSEAFDVLANMTESPVLDAEILLCKVLEKDRAHLRAWPERELNNEQYQEFTDLIAKRKQGQPIAYLTGIKEFWSREFILTKDVLIPRPETELLVELCLQRIPPEEPCKILDLGTGSGIIAVTLAKERPNSDIIATDISPAALTVAKANASKHNVLNILFYQSNWVVSVPEGQFDFIISNPPYVAEQDPHLQEGDLRFEPVTALIAGQDGLADIKAIAETARNRLKNGGYLLLEHGYNQHEAVQSLLHSIGYNSIETHKDLSGQMRVTLGRNLP